MNVTEKLDLAIKLAETGRTDGGYTVLQGGKAVTKTTYMTNDEWERFLKDMPKGARREYGEGSGDELSEKNGRPPKMASYGSSSRMIYALSRTKKDFHYEKKLPTTVGGKANLDGFCEDGDRYIFVEAKCREPYLRKKSIVSARYAALYEYIHDHMGDNLQIAMEPCGKDGYMEVAYFSEYERLEHFDIKQMICHLLGIATGLLNGTLQQKQTDFIYLLYDPTELALPCDAKEPIHRIYEKTCYECNLIDFAQLFRVILEFLRKTKFPNAMSDGDIDTAIYRFTFALASQDFYPLLIK